MKLIIKCICVYIYVFIMFNHTVYTINNELNAMTSKTWCWTKPIYVINDVHHCNTTITTTNGGVNWGMCNQLPPSYNDKHIKKEYIIYIRTSSLPNSEAHGVIMISLIGSEETSKEIELTSSGFKSGAFDKVRIFTEDVGNIYAIKLTAKNRLQWRCNTIRIESHMNFWDFECDKALTWPSAMIELGVSNLIEYSIIIKVNANEQSGTSLPVYIRIYGMNERTPFKLLSNNGFMNGAIITKNIKSVDVGVIVKIALIINGNDDLLIDEIIIRKHIDNEYNHSIQAQTPHTKLTTETIFHNIDNKPIIGLTPLILISSNNNHISSFNTSLSLQQQQHSILSTVDTQSIIKLSCYDILKDNDNFGPLYYHNNVNYDNYLIECPFNCLLSSTTFIPVVYGIGIHPEESPICLSAIIDNASSIYGGVISLSIQNGLLSYTGNTSKHGIHISSYAKSKRSYTLSKVDNVDIIESDVRILNDEGRLSNEGRIEMRLNGKWSTICEVNALYGDNTANVACRQLGYDKGYVLNESNGYNYNGGYCSNYNGNNYCGVKTSYVMFANVYCKGNEINLLDCERQSPLMITQCVNNNHNYDLLVRCEMNTINNDNNDNSSDNSYKQNTLRLIGFDNKVSTNGIGRVEILRTTWGTLCNNNNNYSYSSNLKSKRINNKIGNIICKQMGYIDGTTYDKCNNIQGYNLCGNTNTPINISNIKCKGHETKLHHCKHSDITIDCLHTNDIVVKCIGYGDGSGLSQNTLHTTISTAVVPYQHRLPMQPIFPANCETTLKHLYFRGDPGSIYMINCPMNCHKAKYAVYGNGIYTIDSSLCRSAIHSGVITYKGGDVVVVKTYGQNHYYNSSIRNVDTLEHTATSISFYLTQVNSGYYYLLEMFHKVNAFIEMYSQWSNSNSAHKEIKAVFEWLPTLKEVKFDHKEFVDLTEVDNYKKVFELKVFTIYMKVKMNSFYNEDNGIDNVLIHNSNRNKQTIFSIGGCEGFSININSNSEIVFDVKCSSKIYGSTIYMPVNTFITCAVVYDGDKLNFYLNNKKLYEKNVNLHLHYSTLNKITLGKSSEYDNDYLNGDIKFIAVFKEALPLTSIQYIYVNGYAHPDKTKITKSYTLDNRECISICYNLPIPGYPGSPNPPHEATDIIVNHNINHQQTIIVPFIEVKCTMSARDLGLRIGDTVRIKCIEECTYDMLMYIEREYKKKSVVGSLIYNIDSLLCYSAIHSGVLSYSQFDYNNNTYRNVDNNIVIVNVLEPLQYYHGSFQYNIQSADYNSSSSLYHNEYSFSFEHSPPIPLITCQTTITSNITLFNSTLSNIKYQVTCPSKCTKHQHHVYGDILYSGDSSICQSAIHAGAITDKGGSVTFTITKGLEHYTSKKSFNILSKEHDYYINSIQFHNTNYKLTAPYVETCAKTNLNINWDFINDVHGDRNNYVSHFKCNTNPTMHSHIKNKLTSYIIKPHTKITSTLPLHYGTLMLLKDTDIVNALFQISFYFNTLNPIAIIFRYKDMHNFFHLRLCDNNNNNKLILYQKLDGKDNIIGEYDISLIPRIWYTFHLQIYYEEIKVLLSIGNARSYENVIYVKDNNNSDLQRGRIGIGVDGNDDVYINNIYISDYNETTTVHENKNNNNNNMYVFDSVMKYNTLKTKDKYCKALYERQGINVAECKQTHKYCALRCNELVHKRENILHYTCYKSCIQDTIQRENNNT